ncbi:hypothetical protein HNP40_003028 [Mycobacteroides chelonae]|nr:hypothetical protein [Mycobacteroides chelonae]
MTRVGYVEPIGSIGELRGATVQLAGLTAPGA